MRPSLVVFLLLLSSLLHEAQGTRWEKRFMQVGAHKAQKDNRSLKESVDGTTVLGEVIICKEGYCAGTVKKRVSTPSASKKAPHHWLPSIHEDYCGPKNHRPRHH